MKATYFPCVKGAMGDWVYYVTVMGVSDLVRYVKFAEQVCPNDELDRMLQREVSNRSKDIAKYLRSQEQRFFGSLIVAAYDGEPRFLPIGFGDAPLLGQLEGRVGVLQFDGSEQYYALDGQHRLAALKTETEEMPARYAADQVSVIVICHASDDEGMARARRLFTTVNRYAKKTSSATHTAMSEDDGVAILTRRLVRTHPLFKLRVKVISYGRNNKPRLASGNAMSASDSKYLMAIETFRKANQKLLPPEFREEFSNEQQMPNFEALEAAFVAISARWDEMIDGVAAWKTLLDPHSSVGPLRTTDGGHVLARPIGITAFVTAFASAENLSAAHIRAVVGRFHDLNSAPWKGVLWNSATRRMNVTVEAEKLSARLWRYLLGADEEQTSLTNDWRAMIDPGNEREDLRLPPPPQLPAAGTPDAVVS